MTAVFEHLLPWTEEEYLALGETAARVELFDGSLLISAAPDRRHQSVRARLTTAFASVADAAGLDAVSAVNVRLERDRITIPDLVVVGVIDYDELVVDASTVRLIGEVVSPESAVIDRVLKMHYYAETGIPWYLLVEPEPEITLRLFGLDDGRYAESAVGRPGKPLRLTEPVRLDLDPAVLLPRR